MWTDQAPLYKVLSHATCSQLALPPTEWLSNFLNHFPPPGQTKTKNSMHVQLIEQKFDVVIIVLSTLQGDYLKTRWLRD